MTTAFQVNAFQPDAFQERAGLTDAAISISINAQLEGDSGSVQFKLQVSGGVPGGHSRYVAFINGERYVGSLSYIQSVIEAFAHKQAQKAIEQAKAPKKPRIVVQPGKPVVTNMPGTKPVPETASLQVQQEVRSFYLAAYERALEQLQDEEDTLMVLL